MDFLLIATTIIIILLCYRYYNTVHRRKQFLNNFATPPTKFFVGHALDFKSPKEFLEKLHEYTNKYGSMIHIKIGPINDALVTSDVKFLEFLLSDNKLLKKTPNLKFLSPWIGDGLVTSDGGPKWKIHRKLITPAFHFKILEQFIDIFEDRGNDLIKELFKESGKQSVDIYPYISKCALEAIAETAMGTKLEVQNDETNSYFQSVKDMCRIFVVRTTSALLIYNILFRFSKYYKIQQKAVKILHDYTNKVIQTRREALLKSKKNNKTSDVDDLGRKKKKAFLDLILEARVDNQLLSAQEIREEVDTFMFGGHDTTSTAMSFILYCIANNKEVQDKILKEQEEIFQSVKNPTDVTYTNLQEMKYLENVIKEGLRLYPPAPIVGRLIHEDTVYNGMTIPSNTGAILFIHGVHMNPEYYPNPEQFLPSRFESTDKKNPFSYIPFSAGPRNCIGQKYAMLEMKSMLSKVVRNFELSAAVPKHEMCLSPETVLKSLNGVKIGLKLRS